MAKDVVEHLNTKRSHNLPEGSAIISYNTNIKSTSKKKGSKSTINKNDKKSTKTDDLNELMKTATMVVNQCCVKECQSMATSDQCNICAEIYGSNAEYRKCFKFCDLHYYHDENDCKDLIIGGKKILRRSHAMLMLKKVHEYTDITHQASISKNDTNVSAETSESEEVQLKPTKRQKQNENSNTSTSIGKMLCKNNSCCAETGCIVESENLSSKCSENNCRK